MKSYPKDQDRVIDWFAAAIRSKIAAKSHKGDWKDMTIAQMFEYAKGEMDELELAIIGKNPVEILLEAADVAACVMMAADIANGCPRPDEAKSWEKQFRSLQAKMKVIEDTLNPPMTAAEIRTSGHGINLRVKDNHLINEQSPLFGCGSCTTEEWCKLNQTCAKGER